MAEYLKPAQPQPTSVTDDIRATVSEILLAVERETLPGVVLGQRLRLDGCAESG